MIALLATIDTGRAAFCCGGPPIDPVVLGADEDAGISAGATPARWTVAGALGPADGGRGGVAIGARLRLVRWAQVGVVVPASIDTLRGPGLDDPVLLGRLEPGTGALGRPLPVLTVSLAPPLGRRLDDVLPWWHASIGPGIELRGEHAGGGLFATWGLPFGAPDPSVVPGASWELGAAGGPRGTWGSVAVGAGARGTTRGRIDGDPTGAASIEPVVRGALTVPWSHSARVVVVAEAGAPVPRIGRNADLDLALSGAVVRTW